MAEKPNTELEKPAGAQKPAGDDVVIHVIPEKFYGAALKKKVSRALPPPVAPTAGTPVRPAQAPQEAAGSNIGLIIGIIAAVLLLGGGAAAYFLFFAEREAPPPVCGDNICAAPAESPNSCPDDCGPPPPVCGDSKCESPVESPFTCAEDCGPPPPVCGNKKCEDPTESPDNCPVDCGLPPAVCGNDKCEADEDYKSCPTDCEPPEPVVALDTDSDGITDIEEQQIYGSKIDNTDSDGDSFVDLNEVLNLFDPSKPDPAKLIDAAGVTLYRNIDFGFDIFRPTAWTVKEDAATMSATFTATTGETISVTVKEKGEGVSLTEWVLEQMPGAAPGQIEALKTRKGFDQVLSPDRRTAYIALDGHVLVVSYDLGDQLEIRYRVTFTMMINSMVPAAPEPAQ